MPASSLLLDHLMLAPAAIHHVHDAKAPPDDESPAKQAFNLLGRGIGGHVKVLGAQAHQQVAHGATDNVGFKTGLLEGVHHVAGAFVHQFRVNAVLGSRDFLTLAK
jgi:hypothetical protein